MDINMIITVALYALAAILVLGNLLKGMRKYFLRSFLRLCFTVAAAVFAFTAMQGLYETLGSPAMTAELFAALKAQPEMQSFTAEIEQIQNVMPGAFSLLFLLPVSLVGPVLFVTIFGVVRFLMGILYLIVSLFIPKKKSHNSTSKLLGGLCGALKGVLLTAMVIFPIAGYCAMGGQVMEATDELFASAEDSSTVEEAEKVLELVHDHPVTQTVSALGGKQLFGYLTSFTYVANDGSELSVSWEKELTQYAQMIEHVLALQGVNVEDMQEEQIDAIKALASDLQGSKTLSIVAAELLSGACTAWSEGESFLGKAKPTVDSENVEAILNSAIDTFKNSTPQTVGEDILSVAELFTVMDKYDVFAAVSDPDQLMDLLSDDAILKEAIAVLKDNDRLEAVLKETVKSGVKMAVSSALTEEEYDEAMDAINQAAAEQLNALSAYETAEEKQAAISAAITEAMGEYGVEKGGAAADYVAEILMEEFADQSASGTVTPEDIATYFGLAE